MSTTTQVITLNNGSKIPWIGYGTGTALYQRDADGPVTQALNAGFKHVDGAQMYKNEDSLGKAIAKFPRDSVWVTTKLATLAEGETVRDSLKGSLKRLGLEYVDLWLIHSPKQHQGRIKEIWKQFEEVHKEGLAKNIGVSNFRIKDFEELLDGAEITPAVNQIEFHPYVYKSLLPLVEFQKKHNIKTESFGGLIPVSTKTDGPLAPVLKEITAEVSKRRGSSVTEAQILLKWLEAKDIIIVTTSSKETRLKEYLDAVNVPSLTAEEIKAIDEAGAKLHYRRFATHMDE